MSDVGSVVAPKAREQAGNCAGEALGGLLSLVPYHVCVYIWLAVNVICTCMGCGNLGEGISQMQC